MRVGAESGSVNGQFFISLLNPGIGLLFAIAFFLLWLNRRERYVAYAAGAYTASALAFLIQDVGPVLPMELQRLPANLGFLATGVLFAAAIIKRYALPVPWRTMGVTVAVSITVFLWFLLGQPDIAARILSISIGAGIIAAMVVRALWPIDKPYLIDRVLFWVAALSALNLIIRPIVLLSLVGGFDNYVGFQQSVYWTTVQFSQAMVSIVAAISLMVAVAIDQISELRRQVDDDNLSGLLNRRGFEAQAGAALRRCIDEDRPVALMIADLDHFKSINDNHGHAVGDAIIAAFGAHVRLIGPPGNDRGAHRRRGVRAARPRRRDRGRTPARRSGAQGARRGLRRPHPRQALSDDEHRDRDRRARHQPLGADGRRRSGALRGKANGAQPRARLHPQGDPPRRKRPLIF